MSSSSTRGGKKDIKHSVGAGGREERDPDDLLLGGCFLTCTPHPSRHHHHHYHPLRLSRQTSCIHPFIHPFDIHPSVDDSDDQDWNHPSGLLEEAMVTRRAVALSSQVLWVETPPGLTRLWLRAEGSIGPRALATSSRYSLTHTYTNTYIHARTHTHISYMHEH